MILDALNQFSIAQAVTVTALSQNAIDLSSVRDIGADLEVAITVAESAAASGAATVTIQFVSSASSDLSSATVLSQSGAIGKSELMAGRRPISLKVPRGRLLAAPLGHRFVGLQYVVGTGPLTAGQFNAALVDSVQGYQSGVYPGNYTVV